MKNFLIFKYALARLLNVFIPKNKLQKRYVILHEINELINSNLDTFNFYLKKLSSSEVRITFDDGFYSSYKAIRELKNIKAIFFVCPGFINKSDNARKQFFTENLGRVESLNTPDQLEVMRPASWNELQELIRLGHVIGSHTMNHRRLSKIISQKELEYEIIGSGDILEDRLGCKVNYFAYPFGDYKSIDHRALQIIKKRYTHCFTGVRGNNILNKESSLVWRDAIDLSWPMDYIDFILKGGLDWMYYVKRLKLLQVERRSDG